MIHRPNVLGFVVVVADAVYHIKVSRPPPGFNAGIGGGGGKKKGGKKKKGKGKRRKKK